MDVEGLYDTYLDLCVAGTAPPPETFFREHPEADEEFRLRVRALFDGMQEARDDRALPFERLGEFRLLRRLDEGGMGSVFVAEQESLDRIVALKVVRADARGSEAATRRFEREVRAVARLRHPNLVTVHGAGEDQGVRYLVMEFVPGRRLDDLLAQVALGHEALPPERAVRWTVLLARALAYAHEQGIVHRDVKPANIRITPDDRPLLLDFGVAHDMTPDAETLTRDFAGSPAYAAPEQIDPRRPVDGRTDVYALGATLYQCLTGVVPFAGERMEAVFHRVLTEDPVPPRQLTGAVGRDLEIVTLKALEKRPADRYASAAAFADDLDAVLAFRSIQALAPGRVAAVLKWARRRPATAVAVAACLLLVLLVGAQRLAAAAARRAEARELLATAHARLDAYREERRRTTEIEREVSRSERALYASYMDLEDDERRTAFRREMQQRRRLREETFYAILDLLRRAEQLDAALAGTDAVRAELYVEKWREAEQVEDTDAEVIYRNLVERYDPHGGLVTKLYGTAELSVVSDPPGAGCFLFRYLEQSEVTEGGERRMVPVPYGGASTPVPPGSWVMRVVKGRGEVARGDLLVDLCGREIRHAIFVGEAGDGLEIGDRLVSVDGRRARDLADLDELDADGPALFARRGVPQPIVLPVVPRGRLISPRALAERGGVRARVFRAGDVREVVLPAGLEVRVTAAPLFASPACRIGRTPIRNLSVPPGAYLALLRHPEREPQRFPFWLPRGGERTVRISLLVPEARPEGFVHVAGDEEGPGFWILEREVTALEYLAFLNDPATRARIDAAEKTILVPRSPQSGPDGDWPRDGDGHYHLPERVRPDFPAVGLSWQDAIAYADWRRDREGRPYAIPTQQQWERAGRGRLLWHYPYGHRFEPKWAKSCFSRRTAWLEPVLSYPVDESPYGVFDMSGSAGEWLDAWWGDPANGLRPFGGGSWAYAQPHLFHVPGGNGIAPHMAYWMFGLRLVLPAEDVR